MTIRLAAPHDIAILSRHDQHIRPSEWENLLPFGRVYVAEEDGVFAGWLRYGLFWDNTPFLNMMYLLEPYRAKGYGKQFITTWEADMKAAGYTTVMTSTPSDETSQHFYRQLGYKVIGGFLLEPDPFELILSKCL